MTVDFPPLTPPSDLRATVTHWRPVRPDGGGDIALLTLADAAPGTAPVRFAGGTATWDHAFRVLGFPARTDDHGVWVDGRLRAPVGKGWTAMEARPLPGGPPVGRGFSGAPVWDTDQGGVVGMTVAAETGTGATTAYLLPAALLLGLDPALRPSPFRGPGTLPGAGRRCVLRPQGGQRTHRGGPPRPPLRPGGRGVRGREVVAGPRRSAPPLAGVVIEPLCRLRGPRPPDVTEFVAAESLGVSPDADMTPPCPDPR